MIQIKKVNLQRGSKVLFNDSSLEIHKGYKVGIIGVNGSGKSSLLGLLNGNIKQDSGDCLVPDDWIISHMEQEIEAVSQSAIEYVLDGDELLRSLEGKISLAKATNNENLLGELYSELESMGGYTSRYRAEKIMSKLGVEANKITLPLSSFSGGWRMRLSLARALISPSDLLLLDEPTNHLDIDAILWLEDFLKNYKGTLIVISHDRDFLDAVITNIVHIEHHTFIMYRANYTSFNELYKKNILERKKLYEKQQSERKHMQDYISRFRAQATKARQAQSRIKVLERMEDIKLIEKDDAKYDFSFNLSIKTSNTLLDLSKVSLAYEEKVILKKVTFKVEKESKVGLLGPNGSGKSTLAKYIADKMSHISGSILRSNHLKIGYFSQHQLESLDLEGTPLGHLQSLAPYTYEKKLRDFLGKFGFQGDRVNEIITKFSGGEKSRLVIALIAWISPNLLILDEPTNHLDFEMRDALISALKSFNGALVIISHDRYFLNKTVKQYLLVADYTVKEFTGDLNSYAVWLSNYRSYQSQVKTNKDHNPKKILDNKTTFFNKRKYNLSRKRVGKLEEKLDIIKNNISENVKKMQENFSKAPYKNNSTNLMITEQKRLEDLEKECEESLLEALEELYNLAENIESTS